MVKHLTKLVLAFICIFPTFANANYTITPVKMHIKPGSVMASLTVYNHNEAPRHFQIRLYKTDSKGHEISKEETKDLVVSPAMFNANEKKGQIIRVAVRKPDEAFKHKYYVMSIKELPHGKEEANTVKLVTDFRVPVLVGEQDEVEEDKENKEDKPKEKNK
jgi:P pilus assembly chaperone PapD